MRGLLSPATNLPRNMRLSTLMGRKKERREEIQREWSGARPPAASTQWTWVGAEVGDRERSRVGSRRWSGTAGYKSALFCRVREASFAREGCQYYIDLLWTATME